MFHHALKIPCSGAAVATRNGAAIRNSAAETCLHQEMY